VKEASRSKQGLNAGNHIRVGFFAIYNVWRPFYESGSDFGKCQRSAEYYELDTVINVQVEIFLRKSQSQGAPQFSVADVASRPRFGGSLLARNRFSYTR
jgi:hypothetical protein